MWSPENYYSWSQIWNLLSDATELAISLRCNGGESKRTTDGRPYFGHSAEFYLTRAGLADSYGGAELIVGITTTMLLVKFMEDYPPTLANLDGNKVNAEQVLFEHRDQLDLCRLDWPVSSMAEFTGFFRLQKEGRFNTDMLLDRFAFINFRLGEIQSKNGGRKHLIDGMGCEQAEADRVIALVDRLSGYVICWPEIPKGQEFRDFLSDLDDDGEFSMALDIGFGPPSGERVDARPTPQKKPRGRPGKRA